MGSGGALLVCSLFFLYVAHPCSSCSLIPRLLCNREITQADGSQRCRGHLFQCTNSTLEIKFGGRGQWFRVVGEETLDGLKFEIEDPTLSHVFGHTDCDFLYMFPQPSPLFTPPQTLPTFPGDLRSYCYNVSDYSLLFSILIKTYQQKLLCTSYNLYRVSKELHDLQHPVAPNRCLPAPDPPAFIWKLSMNNNSDGNFTVLAGGFSLHHGPHPECFQCTMTGGHCDSGSQGYNTCAGEGQKHGHTGHALRTGLITAAGLSIFAGLLFYLWCRRKKNKIPSSSTSLFQTAALEPSYEEEYNLETVSIIYPTHVFRFAELHEATDGFSPSNELDRGGHGIVYRGTLPDGQSVAIKRLYENSCRCTEQFINEIAILSRLRHPNLVTLYGCTSRHSREHLLVYEFIPNGTIADHLHGRRAAEGALAWPLRLRIAVETATALAYLHSIKPQIIHRDVKTSNILLNADFHVKVADFGLSRLFPLAASHVSTVPQGTPGYVDPEYYRCYHLTDKSDVYSFGVVLAELISSKPAVDLARNQNEVNLSEMALNKIQSDAVQELMDPKLGFETDLEVRRSMMMVAELVMRCLQGEREMRPTMKGVLEVLLGIADGFYKQEGGDGMGVQKDCTLASPDSVMCKWSTKTTTPNASG